MSSSTGRTCMRRRVMPMVLAGSDGSSTSTCGGLNPSLHDNVATAFYGWMLFFCYAAKGENSRKQSS